MKLDKILEFINCEFGYDLEQLDEGRKKRTPAQQAAFDASRAAFAKPNKKGEGSKDSGGRNHKDFRKKWKDYQETGAFEGSDLPNGGYFNILKAARHKNEMKDTTSIANINKVSGSKISGPTANNLVSGNSDWKWVLGYTSEPWRTQSSPYFQHLIGKMTQAIGNDPIGYWNSTADWEALEKDIFSNLVLGEIAKGKMTAERAQADGTIDFKPVNEEIGAAGVTRAQFMARIFTLNYAKEYYMSEAPDTFPAKLKYALSVDLTVRGFTTNIEEVLNDVYYQKGDTVTQLQAKAPVVFNYDNIDDSKFQGQYTHFRNTNKNEAEKLIVTLRAMGYNMDGFEVDARQDQYIDAMEQ